MDRPLAAPTALLGGAFVTLFFLPELGHKNAHFAHAHAFCQTLWLRRGALGRGLQAPPRQDNAAAQTLLLSPAVVGPMTGAPARASASCLFPLTFARARSVDAQEAEGQRCWQGEHGRGGE